MLSAKALFNDVGSKWPLFIVAFTLGGGIVTHDPQFCLILEQARYHCATVIKDVCRCYLIVTFSVTRWLDIFSIF